jgi:hypothetical protein
LDVTTLISDGLFANGYVTMGLFVAGGDRRERRWPST